MKREAKSEKREYLAEEKKMKAAVRSRPLTWNSAGMCILAL